jgi:hypothetical protein
MSDFDLFAFDDIGLEADLLGDPMADPLGFSDTVFEPEVITETAEFWAIPGPDDASVAATDLQLPNPFQALSAVGNAVSALGLAAKAARALRRKRPADA